MVRVSAANMERWSGWAKGAGGNSLRSLPPQDEVLYLDNLEIWVAESPSCWAAAHYGQACLGCLEEEWLPPPVTQSPAGPASRGPSALGQQAQLRR